jgi:hypothetical protein
MVRGRFVATSFQLVGLLVAAGKLEACLTLEKP